MQYIQQGDTSVTVLQTYLTNLALTALTQQVLQDKPYAVEQSATDMLYVFGNWNETLGKLNAMVNPFGYKFVFGEDTISGVDTSTGTRTALYLMLVDIDEDSANEAAV